MISVIIPAYNEEKALPNTLDCLLRQPGDYEVLVVDGGSADRTLAVLDDFGFSTILPDGSRDSSFVFRRSQDASRNTLYGSTLRHAQCPEPSRGAGSPSRAKSGDASRRWVTAPKGRASQMNAGANEATGDWFIFLHADTILPAGAIQRLNKMEADDSIQAGGFMHQFSGNDWRLKLLSLLNNFRCTRSRIIYGDQAFAICSPC